MPAVLVLEIFFKRHDIEVNGFNISDRIYLQKQENAFQSEWMFLQIFVLVDLCDCSCSHTENHY